MSQREGACATRRRVHARGRAVRDAGVLRLDVHARAERLVRLSVDVGLAPLLEGGNLLLARGLRRLVVALHGGGLALRDDGLAVALRLDLGLGLSREGGALALDARVVGLVGRDAGRLLVVLLGAVLHDLVLQAAVVRRAGDAVRITVLGSLPGEHCASL
eukprot:5767100-Prymnesium_polylepis.1